MKRIMSFLRGNWDNIQWMCPKGCYYIKNEKGYCIYCGTKLILKKYFYCSCGEAMLHPKLGRMKDMFCSTCGKSRKIGLEIIIKDKERIK